MPSEDYTGKYKHLLLLLVFLLYIGFSQVLALLVITIVIYGPVQTIPWLLKYSEYVKNDFRAYVKLWQDTQQSNNTNDSNLFVMLKNFWQK